MVDTELQEKLKEILEYNPETGDFIYKVRRGYMLIGEVAGSVNSNGYRQIQFEGKSCRAHRLAFLYMTGAWPVGEVDHKDTDRLNNSWDNLRDVDPVINRRNKSIHRNNTSGIVGVSWNKSDNRWRAYIGVDGKIINIGQFIHKEDAIFARMTAEKDYGYWVDKVWDQL